MPKFDYEKFISEYSEIPENVSLQYDKLTRIGEPVDDLRVITIETMNEIIKPIIRAYNLQITAIECSDALLEANNIEFEKFKKEHNEQIELIKDYKATMQMHLRLINNELGDSE